LLQAPIMVYRRKQPAAIDMKIRRDRKKS